MDIANGFGLILGFLNLGIDSIDGVVFDLGSSSMAYPSIKNVTTFNP